MASNPPLRFREICVVDFKSNKFFDTAALRCDRGITDAEKRIQHCSDARCSVQFNAPFGELNRKCRRMRSLSLSALNCLVRDKPRVPAATHIFSPSMRPARDVALVLIRHAKRQPIQVDATGSREMKNVFMAIVQKSLGVDGLEMAERFDIVFHSRPALRVPLSLTKERIEVRVARAGFSFDCVDRDGFDPVNRVLQHERLAQCHDDFVRQQRIRGRGADVKKK